MRKRIARAHGAGAFEWRGRDHRERAGRHRGRCGQFRCGRQFAAWLGLTPRQYSTGGKARLGRITRRGDAYLRTLLVQGARSALQAALRAAPTRRTRLAAWIVSVHARIGYHKTLVAIANKHARLVWALLMKDEPLRAHSAAN